MQFILKARRGPEPETWTEYDFDPPAGLEEAGAYKTVISKRREATFKYVNIEVVAYVRSTDGNILADEDGYPVKTVTTSFVRDNISITQWLSEGRDHSTTEVDALGVANRGNFVATRCTRFEDEERWAVDLETVDAFVDFFVEFGASIDRYTDRLPEIVIY